MNKIITYGIGLLLASSSIVAHGIPTLQVGAKAGSGDIGTYADYQASLTDPTETNTAVTSGSEILFAGAFKRNTITLGAHTNWSQFGQHLDVFNGHNAIAMVSVQDGLLAQALANLTLGGVSAFHSSATLGGLFPNNHDPLKDTISDFLFFDIGSFGNMQTVANFDSENDFGRGEIKELAIAGLDAFSPDWLHFDVMAIEESLQGRRLRYSWENNPGSKDVTWKKVPEPSILAMMGLGLLLLGFSRRKHSDV